MQQREGRAGPGVRLPAGGWADVSPALEAEAWQQARRAADGRPARPGAAHSAPTATAPVIQGAFTVSATVSSGGESEDRGAADLRIDEVQMTDKKRPPTRLGKSQGRHTVSWQAKTRYWAALLSDKTYAQAIATLTTLAAEDEAIDSGISGQAEGARELRARLVAKLQTLDTAKRMPESEWIETLDVGRDHLREDLPALHGGGVCLGEAQGARRGLASGGARRPRRAVGDRR